MLKIKEALELTSIEALRTEIELRRELIGQMVGRLYPSILDDEIYELTRRLVELKLESPSSL